MNQFDADPTPVEPMRIDVVTDTFPPDINGVAMTLGRLTSMLKKRGHFVHVIHTGAEVKKGESGVKGVALPGYSEVRIGLPSPIKLRQRWKKKRPDVLYVATESPLGISALNAAKELGIPVAAGFHTNFHQYMQKYRLGKMQNVAMKYLKRVHDKASCTLAPSPDMVKMLEDAGFRDVHLLGRGVDTELFSPEKRSAELRAAWGARGDSPVVIIVGRVAPEKNLDLAMKSILEMKKRVPDLQAVVVGDGPCRAELERDNRYVHFVGTQTGDSLATHYASADILLFPSETETFGNVLLEGMASRLVTVSYNYAASAQYIEPEKNGLHVELGDDKAYVEAALKSLEYVRHGDLRDKAMKRVRSQSWHKVVTGFERRLAMLVKERPAHLRRKKKDAKLHLRSLFLSDIHLGSKDAKTSEVVDMLKRVTCARIYLNGDIIDGWALKRGEKWENRHTKVVRVLLKKMEKEGTQIIYLRGNHDDILERFMPMDLGNLRIKKEHIHETLDGKKYLVLHGDGFDSVATKHKWLAKIGAVGYDTLLNVNRLYNKYRSWRGKEYYSLSKVVKAKVKSAVSFIDKFQEQLQDYAEKRGCDGVICGHIHTPANEQYGETHYLNSGDWVETMSCIMEFPDGRMEVVHYDEFCSMLDEASPAENSFVITKEREEMPASVRAENRAFRRSAENSKTDR